MKKLILFIFFLALIIAGAAYYFYVYDNHTGVRVYTTALDQGIKQVMANYSTQDQLKYNGLDIEERSVICEMVVEEKEDGQTFIEHYKAQGFNEDMIRTMVKTMLYDKVSDLVVPIHKLNFDFIVRLTGSKTRTTFDVPFPHN